MDRHFDRIPDEILWAILQWVQPHVPLMSLGSEASMIRASAPSDPSDEDPVRLTAMRWRGFDAISEGNAGESIPTPPLETLLSGVCRRWRRLSFSLRNDWAAFDPTILFSGQMDNVFTHAFSAMLHDSARLSALRHFAPRLFGAAEGLAKKHAELLLRKIKPAQLHTFDVAFGVDVLHKAPQLVTKCLDWFLRGAVDTLGLESFRLTSLSIEWSLEENPHHERIRPQIANLMAKAPRLCHICIYNAPNKILEQVKGSGGFTKTLKSLLFSANTTFAEPVKLDILSHAIASNCLETLVLDEGFEGELSLGVDSLKELTISRTSFIDEDWREPVWTFDILESLPLAARQQIKTLRILFPSDTWYSEVSVFNGSLAIRFLSVLKEFTSLEALELEMGRIKLGHLALILKLIGTNLKILRVGRIFDTAFDDTGMYFALEEHVESEISPLIMAEDDSGKGAAVATAIDREFPDVTTTIVRHERYRDGEQIVYVNIQQDALFWPTELEVGEKGQELWKHRAKRMLRFYCPHLEWSQLWYGFTDDWWAVAFEGNAQE